VPIVSRKWSKAAVVVVIVVIIVVAMLLWKDPLGLVSEADSDTDNRVVSK